MPFSYRASVMAKKGTPTPPAPTNLLYTAGWNDLGQLGLGDTTYRSSPTLVGSGFSSVSNGFYSSLALKGGELWAWGLNEEGQLGIGNVTNISSPVQVGAQTDWSFAHMNGYDFFEHAFGIRGGNLYSWGYNSYGQLGLGDTTQRSSPVQVGSYSDWSSLSTGFYWTMGIRNVADDAGSLWSCGWNWAGQLGHGNTTNLSSLTQVGSDTTWQKVACGDSHAAATKLSGGGRTLWTWGDNSSGQLGDGSTTSRSSPVQVGSDGDWFIVAAGGAHTMAIKTDLTLWAWGFNSFGQLGLGDAADRSSPVLVGSNFTWVVAGYVSTIASKLDGSIWVWGDNQSGELGLGDVYDRSSPVQIGSYTNYVIPQEAFSYDTFSMGGYGSISIIRATE